MSVKTFAVLFSGKGSNLHALIRALHNVTFGDTTLRIGVTITNNPQAGGIAIAESYGIPCHILDHKNYADREAFDTALVQTLAPYTPDLTVLAGFMRILTPVFTQNVPAINLHPSLLPLFKGAHAIKESFESDEPCGGITIHWVNDELDGGAIIAQASVPKIAGESLEAFTERIHALEHTLYPQTVQSLLLKESL